MPEANQEQGQSATPEQEARSMGWVPREEFRGDQTRWVEAEIFLDRGHTVMPILKKTNQRLEEQLRTQAAELANMKTMFSASQESIQELQAVHAEATKAAVARARTELKAQLKEARSEGDVDAELEIRDQLDTLTEQSRAAEQKPAPQQQAPVQQQLHPEWNDWAKDNTWFGTDQRKTMRAMGIAQELRADPDLDGLTGRAFFDKVVDVMNERSGGPRTSKVGESRPSGDGGSGASGGGTSFNSLPAEAKEACDRQGKKLVGPGRAFKDQTAWRTYYTKLYHEGATS